MTILKQSDPQLELPDVEIQEGQAKFAALLSSSAVAPIKSNSNKKTLNSVTPAKSVFHNSPTNSPAVSNFTNLKHFHSSSPTMARLMLHDLKVDSQDSYEAFYLSLRDFLIKGLNPMLAKGCCNQTFEVGLCAERSYNMLGMLLKVTALLNLFRMRY